MALVKSLSLSLTPMDKSSGPTSIQKKLRAYPRVVYQAPNFFTYTVRNSGKGFNLTKKWKGIGTSNMINRAESFNGKLTIQSSPGKGCSLQVLVPLYELNKTIEK